MSQYKNFAQITIDDNKLKEIFTTTNVIGDFTNIFLGFNKRDLLSPKVRLVCYILFIIYIRYYTDIIKKVYNMENKSLPGSMFISILFNVLLKP